MLSLLVPFRATTSEIIFDMATGLSRNKGCKWKPGRRNSWGPTRAGGTDENWKGRKRMQMTSSEMKVGTCRPWWYRRGFSLRVASVTMWPLEQQKGSSPLEWPTQCQEKGKWCISNGRLRANSRRLSKLCLSDGVSWQTHRANLERAPQGTRCLLPGCKYYPVFNVILLPFCLARQEMMWV